MNGSVSNLVVSLIRTGVAVVIGAFVTWAIRQGWLADSSVTAPLTEALVVVVTGAYYLIVRLLESKWAGFGWLLGIAKAPAYSPPAAEVKPPAPVP
jgi:hypothetical protein